MLARSKYLILILITFVLLCDISFVLAKTPKTKAPETLEQAEEIGKDILWGLPNALKEPWEQALSLWKKMGDWFLKWLRIIWQKVSAFLGREVEKKKPEIKEELKKEKQELREEVDKGAKSVWQRLKELLSF